MGEPELTGRQLSQDTLRIYQVLGATQGNDVQRLLSGQGIQGLLKNGLNKGLAVEKLEVFHRFPHADVFHGHLELVADANDHTSFGGTIEFGNSQGIDFRGGSELFGRFKGILPGGAIQDE